jgi:hypothetical protein
MSVPDRAIMPDPIRAARVYLRVSTDEQDLTRQEAIVCGLRAIMLRRSTARRHRAHGLTDPSCYAWLPTCNRARWWSPRKSTASADCRCRTPSCLPRRLEERGARLAVPGIVDLADLVAGSAGVARIVLEAVQDMLLRVALQTARDDYETRRERQREGIEIAKRAGRYNGRKPDRSAQTHRRLTRGRHEHRAKGRAGGMQHRAGEAGNSYAPDERRHHDR